MSRPIKFRAWDKDDNKMYYAFPNWCISLDGDIYTNADPLKNLNKIVELMQFTGLKDKNGKEIYEGDVVRIITDSDNGFAGHYSDLNSEVVWDEDYTAWYLPLGFQQLGQAIGDEEVSIEVIGNIYENGELLK